MISDLLVESNVIHTTANDELQRLATGSTSLFSKSVEDIETIMCNRPIVIASSFQKDSNVLIMAALSAYLRLREKNKLPANYPLIVVTVDTEIEALNTQMNLNYHISNLKRFCRSRDINLHVIHKTPTIDSRFASLFFSGRKFYSTAKTTNDCSDLMKIATAKKAIKLAKDTINYDLNNYVTLLGTRKSESIARNLKMNQRLKTALDVANNYEFQTFEPISNMDAENIWFLLKHASSNNNPLYRSSLIDKPFLTYVDNYAVLKLTYQLSEQSDYGVCPDSMMMLQGAASAGSCGNSGSARSGCYLCLKLTQDKSAKEASNNADFHQYLSGDLHKFRDWLYSESMAIENRTFYSRAIDHTTGHVGITPNSMNAKHFLKAIAFSSVLTIKDKCRALHFKALVDSNREDEDTGIQLIKNDPKLTVEDKSTLIHLYKHQAIEPFINLIDDQISLYISFIHSRDGVALAPFTAFAVWKKAESVLTKALIDIEDSQYRYDHAILNGDKNVKPPLSVADDLPRLVDSYLSRLFKTDPDIFTHIPDVDLASVKEDPIPDLLMYKVDQNLSLKLAHLDSLQLETIATDYDEKPVTTVFNIESKFLGLDSKAIPYLETVSSQYVFTDRKVRTKRKLEASQRKIVKRSKAHGIERGRSRTNSYCFRYRSPVPHLANQFNELKFSLPSTNTTHELNLVSTFEDDSSKGAVWFDEDQMNEYFYGGNDKTLTVYIRKFLLQNSANSHLIDIAINTFERHRATYGLMRSCGTQVYKTLLSWEIIKLSNRAAKNQDLMLKRNDLFKSIGLHDMSVNELKEVCIDTKTYRKIKTKRLLDIRTERNNLRSMLKSDIRTLESSRLEYFKSLINERFNFVIGSFKSVAQDYFLISVLVANGIYYFDRIDLRQYLKSIKSWFQIYCETDYEQLLKMYLSEEYQAEINSPLLRAEIIELINSYKLKLNSLAIEVKQQTQNSISNDDVILDGRFSIFAQLVVFNKLRNLNSSVIHFKTESNYSINSNLLTELASTSIFD